MGKNAKKSALYAFFGSTNLIKGGGLVISYREIQFGRDDTFQILQSKSEQICLILLLKLSTALCLMLFQNRGIFIHTCEYQITTTMNG